MFDCTIVGDAMWDILVKTRRLDSSKDVTYCKHMSLCPGGSANVAVGIAILGGKSAFVGKVGNDALGNMYILDLESHGVNPLVFKTDSLGTGITLSLIDSSSGRSFLVYRGANDLLKPEEVTSLSEAIEHSTYLYVSGFSLIKKPQRDAILKAIEIADKSGVKVVFDPASPHLANALKNIFITILSKSYVLSPNLEEAKTLCSKTHVNNIVEFFRGKVPLLALKLGDKGCILATEDELLKISPFHVRCIDTTGAGDAFTAALIYGLCRGFTLKDAGLLSNWFASRIITAYGARSYPTKDEIEKFLVIHLNKYESKRLKYDG